MGEARRHRLKGATLVVAKESGGYIRILGGGGEGMGAAVWRSDSRQEG